ncbi:normocyte-binding protein [Schinkia azotoformans]|uniref:normocyte-binding protein n=1 Tax=Schinkia azotoformans TaxID=1454 RepID=UPI002E1F7B13|nr:normocyte-binding protein [Schinkia azotoformans]
MKDIILDRLQKMDNLEQRQLLKDIVNGVFLNLVDYQEEMNRKLAERVFNELEDWDHQYDIYVTLCKKENVDPIHEFLYPMIPEDLEESPIDLEIKFHSNEQQEGITLLTIFLQCDFPTIKGLLDHERTFTGEIQTTTGRHKVNVYLKQNKTYLEEIEKLYQLFLINGLPWKTVNHPYAYKFFDVVIANPPKLKEDETIKEVSFDLEEYEVYKKLDMVPLWNIERFSLKNTGFPIPAKDKVNYEHILSVRKMGEQHGYLVDADEESIRYIKRSPEELIVVSSLDKSGEWNVLKITQPLETSAASLDYEILTNQSSNQFINMYARKKAIQVRTKSEIFRMVNSFDAAKYLKLVGVEVKNGNDDIEISYEMNTFIKDDIRAKADKQTMLLHFQPQVGRNYLTNDLMSFLTSEIQMSFPEYRCLGALV